MSSGPTRLQSRPYRFHSAKFNDAQRNYDTTNQELLAIVEGCKAFQQHLIGYPFVVVTDHKALETYMKTLPTLTRRHVRMAAELSRFNFSIEFLEGKSNTIADSLSRLYETDVIASPSDYVQEDDLDDLFPDSDNSADISAISFSPFFDSLDSTVSASLAPVHAKDDGGGIDDDRDPLDILGPLQRDPHEAESNTSSLSTMTFDLSDAFSAALAQSYLTDPKYIEILSNESSWSEFSVDEAGWIYFVPTSDSSSPRLVLPKGRLESDEGSTSPTLREYVLNVAHQQLAHAGFAITLSFLRRFFWWDSISKDTKDFCRSCETCARGKPTTSKPFGLLHPMPVPSRPWESAAMDFITGLPAVLHHFEMVDSILVVTDVFTKLVHLIPLSSAATATDVAQLYHDNIYRLHGLQSSIVSDRDPKFTGNFWKALHLKLGTKLRMSTAAHPETDGISENRVKTVSAALRCMVEDDSDAWASRLTEVEVAINSSVAGATGMAPFELSYGFLPPPFPFATWPDTENPGAEGFAEAIRIGWEKAHDGTIGSRLNMAVQSNKHRRPDSPEFVVGNRVYVDTLHLSFPAYTTRKLLPRYIGPYLITAAFPATSNYEIDFPAHFKVHRRFHASKLRVHLPNDATRFPARDFLTPSTLETGDEAANRWVIEKIVLDRKIGNQARKFLVRYLGYSAAEDEWLTESTMGTRDRAMLVAYIARKGGNLAGKGIKKIRRVK